MAEFGRKILHWYMTRSHDVVRVGPPPRITKATVTVRRLA
jgi:hypothetical protein